MIFQRLTKYGTQANSHDWLKAIAILLMVVDHTGVYFFPDVYGYRFVGRFSFPVFFFLIGYTYNGLRQDTPADSSAWKDYYANLPAAVQKFVVFFWAFNIKSDLMLCLLLITVANYVLIQDVFPLNILATVIVCRVALYLMDKYHILENWLLASWLLLTLLHVPLVFVFEYGGAAILISMAGYLIRQNRRGEIKAKTFIFLTYLMYCASQMIFFPATFDYLVALYTGMAALFVFLSDYKLQKTYLLPNVTAVNYAVMFISRYSLYVYTAHLLAFKITAKYFI
ncbi:MAG: conjugal transfer protein TraX [Gammaproteobacteria bacterium]|nr:conjugal transfer protein TraX [Gammaproteobacteria bacterium]